jgi:enoyl-CoA hydratase/carnithine racemase
MGKPSEGPVLAPRGDFADLLLRFTTLGKPVIARVPGAALGGGLGLVASADFAIACESAVLGTPEIHRGIFPMQIMAVLERLVPRRKLMELMLLGEKLSAARALELGLLSRVVPDESLDLEVDTLARELATRSPTAMRMGLRAFHHQSGKPLEDSLPYLRDQLMAVLTSEDAREGLRAFAEKREPMWTGK